MKSSSLPKPKFAPNKWMNWVLIIALVALLTFTIVYVINIHKMAKRMENFIEEGTSSANYKLVYVYSKTCPHCIEFSPIFDDFTRQLANHQTLSSKLAVEKVERADTSAAKYLRMVEGFPTVMLLKGDELKEMLVGKTDLPTMKAFVEKNVV